MAVDLHTGDGDKQAQHILPQSHDFDGSSTLKPHLLIPHEIGSQEHHDFIAEFTHHMAHFSTIGAHHVDSSWDSTSSLHSTSWSPLGSSQGSPEAAGCSREPSPPPAPGNTDDPCWESTYDVVTMFDKMKLNERGNSKYHPGYGTHASNVGHCSYQPLIQQQIPAIQLSRLKQEQILSLKQKLTAHRETHGQIYEPSEQVLQSQKKGKGVGNGGRRSPPTGAGPLPQLAGSEIRALVQGGFDSRGASCGTGVFLPRGGTSASSESRSKKRPGKGCSSVLIPARVVQALQLQFDHMAATSGPKAAGFPPLHDVLVSNRDGMYSLQKRQSRKAPPNFQNDLILPREWTY